MIMSGSNVLLRVDPIMCGSLDDVFLHLIFFDLGDWLERLDGAVGDSNKFHCVQRYR